MHRFLLGLIIMLVGALSVVPIAAQGTALDIANGNDDFSILVEAIAVADPIVAETLSSAGSITLLAPNNTAFENLASFLDISLEDLLGQPAIVTDLLLYHVLDGEIFSSQIASQFDGAVLPTLLEGAFVNFDVESSTGQLLVNDIVEIIQTDIDASNGVVHVINDVILNRLVNEQINATDFSQPATTAEIVAEGRLRVVHAVADGPGVDIYLGDTPVLTSLAFSAVSDFIALEAGTYDLSVTLAGAPLTDTLFDPSSVTIEADVDQIIAVVGSTEANTLELILLANDGSVADDMSRIDILHGIVDGPDVTVLADGEAIATDLSYPNAASADLAVGIYDLTIVSAEDPDTVLLQLPGYQAEAEGYQFIVVGGTVDEPVLISDVPRAAAAGTNTIDQVIAGDERFALLAEALEVASPSVSDTLGESGPFTLFAPSNRAISNFLASLNVNSVGAVDPPVLTQILLYHVVNDEISAETITSLDGVSIETRLPNGFVAIGVSDANITLNSLVTITETDITASNGVIHIIDNVLLPAPLLEILNN